MVVLQQEPFNEEAPYMVVSEQDMAFSPGERQTACARVVAEQPDELIFRKAKHFSLDDCLAAVMNAAVWSPLCGTLDRRTWPLCKAH